MVARTMLAMVDADAVRVVDEPGPADADAGATENEKATTQSANTAPIGRADRPALRVFVRLATTSSSICGNAETRVAACVRARIVTWAWAMVEQTDGRTA
jgi:hypothetical protein